MMMMMLMQEIVQLKDKMKAVEDDITFATVELDAETVTYKKYVHLSTSLLLNYTF